MVAWLSLFLFFFFLPPPRGPGFFLQKMEPPPLPRHEIFSAPPPHVRPAHPLLHLRGPPAPPARDGGRAGLRRRATCLMPPHSGFDQPVGDRRACRPENRPEKSCFIDCYRTL